MFGDLLPRLAMSVIFLVWNLWMLCSFELGFWGDFDTHESVNDLGGHWYDSNLAHLHPPHYHDWSFRRAGADASDMDYVSLFLVCQCGWHLSLVAQVCYGVLSRNSAFGSGRRCWVQEILQGSVGCLLIFGALVSYCHRVTLRVLLLTDIGAILVLVAQIQKIRSSKLQVAYAGSDAGSHEMDGAFVVEKMVNVTSQRALALIEKMSMM